MLGSPASLMETKQMDNVAKDSELYFSLSAFDFLIFGVANCCGWCGSVAVNV